MFGVEPVWLIAAVVVLAVMIFGWGVILRPMGIGRKNNAAAQSTPPKDNLNS